MKFETDFDALCRDLSALTEGVPYVIANLANTAALLWERMEGLNWAGFYILTDEALVLGPFQGKTACIHDFPGHIACDSASNSEIVVPLYKDGALWGVLDLDSPYVGRFTEADRQGLEKTAKRIQTFL